MQARLYCFFFLSHLNAQQDVMVSQYMFNGILLNPAYSGSHKYFSSSLLHRAQWLNFEGAPQTSILAIDGPLNNQKMGVGLLVSHDIIGVTNQTDVYGNYSYFLKLGPGKLGFGIKAGVSNYVANVDQLVVWDTDDALFIGTKKSALLAKFGFGAYYFTERWYAGFSIPSMLAYDPEHNFNLSLESSSDIRKHDYLTAGYVFDANEKLKIKPSFLIKYQTAAPTEVDINLTAMYIETISLGVSYRTNDAISIMAEYQANKRFRVGYAYDITTSKIRHYSSGTHEIMLGYDFGKDIIKTKTPRFF
ncbi:MAG: type IX secretion system membrane protein PorP/SprF [Bacteroidetes bacterium]|nr:type IX secretion system membrane protein PorP/SprF [Bacteroidota bacterium]